MNCVTQEDVQAKPLNKVDAASCRFPNAARRRVYFKAIMTMVFFAAAATIEAADAAPGWGIDACLTAHVSDDEFPAYIRLLRASGVRVVRERGTGVRRPDGSYAGDVRAKFRALKDAGFAVVAFASMPENAAMAPGNALPDDLRAVFEHGKILSRDFAGLVDAWEMLGEPDVGYCRDLPERAVAYQKALYLGIRAGGEGSSRDSLAIMGALALPPGPWLERAVRNGLLDYTDAYNFHYYGQAADFTGVIRAHRLVAGPDLPLWVTECGMKTVSPGDFLAADRRRLQAAFTVSTARQARQEGMALFMPFILVDHMDPYALTLAADRPLPAWTAYARLTREWPWPQRPWMRRPRTPNPVVVQWVPDNTTTIPCKVSGTYRFRGRTAIRGEMRIYNFSARPVHGVLRMDGSATIATSFPHERDLTVEPGGVTVLHGEFSPIGVSYFQAWLHIDFVSDDNARSPLSFGLETTPQADEFIEEPLPIINAHQVDAASRRVPNEERDRDVASTIHPEYLDYHISSTAGPWLGMNGVVVDQASMKGARFRVTEATGDPEGDPLYPPMAVARVGGLPSDGFLLVSPDRRIDRNFSLRVDLVDDTGQRFTIWENLGQSYFAPARELWLNLRDFHVYFWGRCSPTPRFDPKKDSRIAAAILLRTSG